MRKRLFTAIFALAAIPGFALGGDDSSKSPASPYAPSPTNQTVIPGTRQGGEKRLPSPTVLPNSAPTNQDVSQSPPNNADWVQPTGGALDDRHGPGSGDSWAKSDWRCGPPNCFWVSADYLLWWTKDGAVPPLVTTGVPGATLLPGVLGQPGTRVLLGGDGLDDQVRSGARISGGFWLNNCQTCGVEASYFFLGSRSTRFDDASNGAFGSSMIARPFFDVINGAQNAELVAFPGLASGQIHVSSSSRLQGAELNGLCVPCCTPCCSPCPDQGCCPGDTAKRNKFCNTFCGCNYWVSFLGGVRYLELDEGLGIAEDSLVNPALPAGSPLFGGSNISTTDQFSTHNYFYGGQIGAKTEFCCGRFFVDLQSKIALGATHEVIDINGATVITSPGGATVVTPAGFLASGSNSGSFSRDKFAVVPELGLNVGCQIHKCMRAYVGYTFLYWSSVVRPGDQVDVALSGTQIPTDNRFNPAAGPARPAALLRSTDFWAQGVNFGLEFRY